jgi:hypothetical protein
MKAKDPGRAAGLFSRRIALLQKCDEIGAPENERVDTCDRFKSVLLPLAHGAGRRAACLRSLTNVVGPQTLDEPRRMTPIRHVSAPQAFY